MLLHYLSLLTQLTKGGLRKGYVIREENLQSKVCGRILFQNHLKQNVFNKREDRVFCRYQEYTTDIPENRLLKKALELAKSSLLDIPSLKKDVSDEIFQNVNNLEAAFDLAATEALRNGYCPVFCRNNQKSLGNKKLIELGAIAIDESWDGKLDAPVTKKKDPKEDQLSLFGSL